MNKQPPSTHSHPHTSHPQLHFSILLHRGSLLCMFAVSVCLHACISSAIINVFLQLLLYSFCSIWNFSAVACWTSDFFSAFWFFNWQSIWTRSKPHRLYHLHILTIMNSAAKKYGHVGAYVVTRISLTVSLGEVLQDKMTGSVSALWEPTLVFPRLVKSFQEWLPLTCISKCST